MKVDELNISPITTPEHPDPTDIRRYIRDDYGFYGFDTVFVEEATWKALCGIAGEKDCTVDDLCLQKGAILRLRREHQWLQVRSPDTVSKLLGIEGRAAAAYFKAWEGVPLCWKATGRRPIPESWRAIGPRSAVRPRRGGECEGVASAERYT
jgi:hypothetical protein